MKTKIWLIFILTSALLITSGCNIKHKEEPVQWAEIISTECLSGETAAEKAIAQAVTISAEETSEGVITVTVKAPDVYNGLMAWMNEVSEDKYSDEALEAKFLSLLSEAVPVESTVELSFTKSEDGQKIEYTQEFAELISCGMLRFYGDMMQNVTGELGGAK